MFKKDTWQEIFHTIKENKLRTFLTGFSVAWGIFILIILLGAGNGLENGFMHKFEDDMQNKISIWSGRTTKPYKGHSKWRKIQINNGDIELIKNQIEETELITGRYSPERESAIYRYKNNSGEYKLRAVHPSHQYIEKTIITKGRYITQSDIQYNNKVICIGELLKQALFRDEDPMGKFVEVNNIPFKVVGVFEDNSQSEGEMRMGYLPISTAQIVFGGKDHLGNIIFTIKTTDVEESEAIIDDLKARLAKKHVFAPDDRYGIGFHNNLKSIQETQRMPKAIKFFVWIIGLGTIIAGIVGTSNIMLIVVKERTKEIGICKALGATPAKIISQIFIESVFITFISCYLGMIAGIFTLEFLISKISKEDIFLNPTVDLKLAFAALFVITMAGTIAGLYPARKAAKIKPVIALRDE